MSIRISTPVIMIRTLLFIIFISTLLSFNAQEPFKAIVLINGEAYLVDVTPRGDIITTYQKINNYFSTSESHKSLVTRLSKGARSEGGSIVFYELEDEPVPSFSEENKKPVDEGNDQYIGFSPDRALLLKAAVDQIRRISKGYQIKDITDIDVVSFHRNDYRSKSLARNRANAIKDLLVAFGVQETSIQTKTIQGSKEVKVDFVKVGFQQ